MSDSEIEQAPSPLKQLKVLRTQHTKLYVEREHMVVNVRRNIIAGFQRKLGVQDHALKKAEWEVGRLKRELELVRDSANPGDVDYDRIAAALEEEFDPGEEKLEEAPRQIEWANRRLGAMMTMEQTAAFQARYRRLAERLHPALRFEPSVSTENLWQRVRESYATGDVEEMEALELIAEDLPAEDPEGRMPEEIEEKIAALKAANEKAINEIAAMRQEWPFPLAAKLPDEEWVRERREEYERKTAELISEREVLVVELNRILEGG